jgi:hypothetical protein
MKINGGTPGPIRPDAARDVRAPGADGAGKARSTPVGVDRQDRVEISDAGRARAAEGGLTAASEAASGPARLNDIRQRVLQGAYDTDTVVGEVARRILDRGDI